ncbi:MAG: dynamin family protein [Actinobacteria bacterium]|jgi:GTP-binding protein EngB required for normal cell division|nr:dynamin family protein [Actinomycetota bacterium]MCL6095974.1 dynamin family protein [Actinomycetota bacterium]
MHEVNELNDLVNLAKQLAEAVEDRGELAVRAQRLVERVSTGQFHIVVAGDFKRGKSTLINALLGEEVLPSGVLPLTAIATEVHFGPRATQVVHLDGSSIRIPEEEISLYVTERFNPANIRRVARVEVYRESPLLRSGLVLVDTPGTGSVYLHNSEEAQGARQRADGAIVVLSADSPLSQNEKELLASVIDQHGRVFVVLNKVDYLNPSEIREVREFIEKSLAELSRTPPTLYCIAAKNALAARLRGEAPSDSGEFEKFLSELISFVERDLVGARDIVARRELERISIDLENMIALENAALDLDVATLTEKIAKFKEEATVIRTGFEEDSVLLRHEVNQLTASIADDLNNFATKEPFRWMGVLSDTAGILPLSGLDEGLLNKVEECVRNGFEEFRQKETERVDRAWREIADRFRYRTQKRVDALRQLAASIFEVTVPSLPVPQLEEEQERFFYLFLHIGSAGITLTPLLRRLLPGEVARRRALTKAQLYLKEEFAKHAGRARWDLTQRAETLRRKFESTMRSEVEGVTASILEAITRAEDLRSASQAHRQARESVNAASLEAASRIIAKIRSLALPQK